jgi:hypothetical protein
MVMFRCRACDTEGELGLDWPEGWFWCSNECHQEFAQVVAHLVKGGEPAEIGIDCGSRLLREAIKEVEAYRRREAGYRREMREREYERARPRRLPPIYPV